MSEKRKSPAHVGKQGKSTHKVMLLTLLTTKRLVKFLLINVHGYITPNTYRIYDILFKLLNLREV